MGEQEATEYLLKKEIRALKKEGDILYFILGIITAFGVFWLGYYFGTRLF